MSQFTRPEIQERSEGGRAPDANPIAARGRVASYYELTKPGIAGYVAILAGACYYVASPSGAEILPAVHLLVGASLGTGGALALNQYAERDADAVMHRTRTRPLPSGRLLPREALAFGLLLLLSGVSYLGALVGWLPAALTAGSAAVYLWAYTPMKSRSYLATVVGAVPGAVPALIGWTAATGRIGLGGMVLFAIAFLWQLPHVLALAWLLQDDYERVGFFMLPSRDPSGVRIGRHMVYHTLSLLGFSVLPTYMGLTGSVYLVGTIVAGALMLRFTVAAAADMNRHRARRVFLYSLLYQPVLLVLMVVDAVRP
jgi:protoheme IX farnesyltransferase